MSPNLYGVTKGSTITANGARTLHGYTTRNVVLLVNVKGTPTGASPTLTVTAQGVDPSDEVTPIGPSATVGPLSVAGAAFVTLPVISEAVQVAWVVGGGTPVFPDVFMSLWGKEPDPQLLAVQSRIDIQSSVIYRGEAVLGVTAAQTGWTIQKITLTVDGDPDVIAFTAPGTAIWDNRAGETYS